MFFWKKGLPRDIRVSLAELTKKVKALQDLGRMKSVVRQAVISAKSSIEEVKRAVLERAAEEKSRPWLDSMYDARIDELAYQEVKAVDKLKKDLDDYYMLVEESNSERDIRDVASALVCEAQAIEMRDKDIASLIESFERATRKKREIDFASVPNINTSDGIPFRKIVAVARQFGGIFVGRGRHAHGIEFPATGDVVVLSHNLHSGVIAREIMRILSKILPAHKLPKNISALKVALRSGDIRVAI